MASIRNVKKDIDYLVSEVISDCYTFLYIHGDKNKEQVNGIIEDVVSKRNDFIHRVNNPEKQLDRKQKHQHFKAIYNDLLVTVDKSFSNLSDLTK
jgi:hypothetical protein